MLLRGMKMNLKMSLKMPDLVMNTGPVIALTAAVGSLEFLKELYTEIILPVEVIDELVRGGSDCLKIQLIQKCQAFRTISHPIELPHLLST